MVTFPDCSVRHTVANTAPVGGNENTASELVGVSLPACLPASQPQAFEQQMKLAVYIGTPLYAVS